MFFGHHRCPYYQIISKNRVSNLFEIWRIETTMSHFSYILAAFYEQMRTRHKSCSLPRVSCQEEIQKFEYIRIIYLEHQ